MTRKPIRVKRVEKKAQIEAMKKELAVLEDEEIQRMGKLALKAGLADLEVSDKELMEEFQAIACRFQKGEKEPISQKEATVKPPSKQLTEASCE